MISLAPIGNSPNVDGATLTGNVLNLEPANESFGGVVTTDMQVFSGEKIFMNFITCPSIYLPKTTSPSNGVLYLGDKHILHNYTTGGDSNLFIGENSGNFVGGATSNTCVGTQTGLKLTSGGGSCLFGWRAGDSLTTGSNNIFIGRNAGHSVTSGSGNIIIGYAPGSSNTSNIIQIGNAQTKCSIVGIRGATTGLNGVQVMIDSNGQLGTVASSIRSKKNISALPSDITAKLTQLRPVTFNYIKPQLNEDGTEVVQYGLIAEEVMQTFPELVVTRKGKIETVRYDQLVPLLLASVNKLTAEVERVHSEYNTLLEFLNKINRS